MLQIGCHLAISKGFQAMMDDMNQIGANSVQFFSRNPRGGTAKPLDEKEMKNFQERMKREGTGQIIVHAPYTMNACSADENLRILAKNMMTEDLLRMEYIPGNLYNFHPGSHVKQGVETGIVYISEMLNAVLKANPSTTVLLETMAGKGTEVGQCFEELSAILERVERSEKMGVCLDTCHVWDAGYDIVRNLDGVLEEFDRIIGLSRLKAIHLNDSMNSLGSHKDRHAKIGEGEIGEEALMRVVNHPALKDLPISLETPNDLGGYADEIRRIKACYQESST